jgi:hypothetical protein
MLPLLLLLLLVVVVPASLPGPALDAGPRAAAQLQHTPRAAAAAAVQRAPPPPASAASNPAGKRAAAMSRCHLPTMELGLQEVIWVLGACNMHLRSGCCTAVDWLERRAR